MRGGKPIPLDVRLDRLTIPEPNSGCWLWMGTINGAGYGSIGTGGNRKYGGKPMGAHVAAWQCANGAVPQGLHVCHHCDNKLCVNPGHLYVATTQQNTKDAVERGRYKRGAQRRNARFTDEQIREMREKHAAGASIQSIRVEYGFGSHTHARLVCEGKIWGHVT